MPKIMLINVTHAEESRVGIMADGVLASFEIETFSREHLKSNIYKGVVHRIHPALEAAFVDIGAERDAFLPLDEICFRNLPSPPSRDSGNGGERRRPQIKEILKPGQELLVQIVKEQFANKPPTLSTFYSLPGRYLVLLPGSDEAGISRKIEGPERSRIRELIEQLRPPEGFGIIVRTAASFDEGSRELQRDLTYLLRLWETIQHTAATKRGPASVYREHDLVLRTIRDYFTPDIDEIHIDNEDVFQRAREFLSEVMPGKESVLHLYQGDQPIFSHFNVETQIESIYKRRVPLKSGGGIVIDGTEALTAIDVNSGRSVRGSSQEETAFRTNLEAAVEIARQLRLRDVGGLVVIDFIDMRNSPHVAEVERTLRDAMREDKARHEIGRISQFGLMEISRQRLRPAAAATSYTACPMCEGHGLVRTTESAALVALRKIHNRVAQGDVAALRISAPPDVAVYLLNQKRDDLAQLERRYAARISVVLNPLLMPHQSEFEVRPRVEGVEQAVPQIRLGGVAVDSPTPTNGESPPVEAAAAPGVAGAPAVSTSPNDPNTGKRRRRRRGRRRGRGRQAAAALGEALTALAAGTSLVPTAASALHSVHSAEETTPGEPAEPVAHEAVTDEWRSEDPAAAESMESIDTPAVVADASEPAPQNAERSIPAPRRKRGAGTRRSSGRGARKKPAAVSAPAAAAAQPRAKKIPGGQGARRKTPGQQASQRRRRSGPRTKSTPPGSES